MADLMTHAEAVALAREGRLAEARRALAELPDGALVRSDRAAVEACLGEWEGARAGFHAALELDPGCAAARHNLEVLGGEHSPPNATPAGRRTRVALLSMLFNWPSTGGGIVHSVELGDFLARAGYDVKHFYVRHDDWQVGVVTDPVPAPTHELRLPAGRWSATGIQDAFREAVAAFGADYAIVTDSWNMKPLLALAVEGVCPYLLRLQALECLCPLNNIRLLPGDQGGFRQCALHQLATPEGCRQCLRQRGQRSGGLHQLERALAGVEGPEYPALLRKAFRGAHAVLVVNPLTEAMVAPYAERVRTVTAGMDPARFPDVWPDDPLPPPDRPVKRVLFAGLIDETIKGFAVLHEACGLLWRKRRDFELAVTADPPGRLDAYTHLVGWQSQQALPRVMRGADVVAVPAIAQEALGRTAVEAQAAGRPVVASRLGGLPFTVADGASGLLAEPGDPRDLAEKLERLLDDAGLRERLGRAGRARFLEHYAWPVIIEKHYVPLLGPAMRAAS